MQNIFSNISLTVMIQRNNADICMSLMSSSYVCESIFLLFVKVNLSTSGDGFQAGNGFHSCPLVSLLSDCYLNVETPGKVETKDGLRKMFPFKGKINLFLVNNNNP
jgi:hypothetical protein